MNSLTRLVGFSVLLLLVFVVAALTAQGWLHRQTQLVRSEVLENRKAQFLAALTLTPRPVDQWDDTYRRNLGAVLNGAVTLYRDGNPPLPTDGESAPLFLDEKIGDPTRPAVVRLTFA